MDFPYSSPRDGGCTAHLSPSHPYHVSQRSTIDKLRRSISRSPSKAHRNMTTPSPHSPRSPNTGSPLSRVSNAASPADIPSQLSVPSSARRNRPTLRRAGPLRLLSRDEPRAFYKSPIRRALSDSSDQGNGSPSSTEGNADGQENLSSPSLSPNKSAGHSSGNDTQSSLPFKLRKEAIGSGLAVKSSPLKRSDGLMNLDQAKSGSPSAKRRSICVGSQSSPFTLSHRHSSSESSDSDAEDIQHGLFKPTLRESPFRAQALGRASSFRKPVQYHKSDHLDPYPPRRSVDFSLNSPSASRTGLKIRTRTSLDSTRSPATCDAPDWTTHVAFLGERGYVVPESSTAYTRNIKPPVHPLSQALSPNSSTKTGSHKTSDPITASFPDEGMPINFSKSLPVGALRPRVAPLKRGPHPMAAQQQPAYGTPQHYSIAKPDPAAFRSTGLISKRYRNPEDLPPPPAANPRMPDTPCKHNPLDIISSSPTPVNSAIKGGKLAQPLFGTPHIGSWSDSTQSTPQALEKCPSIFRCSLNQRPTEQEDSTEGDSEPFNPFSQELEIGQSSNDELPPTPTKTIGDTSFVKPNSLRSSLFGRRTSLGPNTFQPPSAAELETDVPQNTSKSSPVRSDVKATNDAVGRRSADTMCTNRVPLSLSLKSHSSFAISRFNMRPSQGKTMPSPLLRESLKISLFPSDSNITKTSHPAPASPGWTLGFNISPHTPAENGIPDPSGLSISPHPESPQSPGFNPRSSILWGRPPETPTAIREIDTLSADPSYLMTPSNRSHAQDIDPVLLQRFKKVRWYGRGEFSEVYRVWEAQRVVSNFYVSPSLGYKASASRRPDRVWIVKKSNAPYHSSKLRQKKIKEVQIMKALGKSDHTVFLVDSWEAHQHLYIQTEFCEEGSLHAFLARTGHKGRLDDFRIWKILIELCQGVKHIHDSGFIHLDLKPANVFIDFEGVLKIGDFGLASEWPAPQNVEGEGDRRYIGPDLLQGHFDKPADVFALGMMMFEIAANAIPPDNGASWHQLRSGDWSNLPSLTSGSSNSIFQDESDTAIVSRSLDEFPDDKSMDTTYSSENIRGNSVSCIQWKPAPGGLEELAQPPRFMLDPEDPEALDTVVKWMMSPDPKSRPVIDQILETGGVQWVNGRRRYGAVVFEGNWGPPQYETKEDQEDQEMLDAL